jgi:hypothetical protein
LALLLNDGAKVRQEERTLHPDHHASAGVIDLVMESHGPQL